MEKRGVVVLTWKEEVGKILVTMMARRKGGGEEGGIDGEEMKMEGNTARL